MKIYEITVILTDNTDKIHFKTDLPTPFPIMGYKPDLRLDVQHGYGEEYVSVNFPGIPVSVIDTRH